MERPSTDSCGRVTLRASCIPTAASWACFDDVLPTRQPLRAMGLAFRSDHEPSPLQPYEVKDDPAEPEDGAPE